MTTNSINTILQHWTGFETLEAIETNELENFVVSYPFSSSLQFLLAKKYILEQYPLIDQQLQKTTSFFPSSIHLHQLLKNEAEDLISAPMEEKLTTMISDQLAQFQKPVQEDATLYDSEPLPHQKDYFGALGIEIDLSKVPQDKFTKQLKSFTAWLKVLKHKDGSPNVSELGEEQEKAITAIAEKANTIEDVVTEAMAEIWEKQGNNRKAIAIYLKLSFIFPEKSVYFASRIEKLKQRK